MENKGVIYKVTSPNNKIYIGQTINFKRRFQKYKYNNFKGQKQLWNNCQKHNWNPNDNVEVIEECLIIELNNREIYWIDFYDSYNSGLNCDLGGVGRSGYKCSEETKEKLREANLGKTHTDETKKKISDTYKSFSREFYENRKTIKGQKRSEETKLKISKANTGKKHTDEAKLKISEANIGNSKMLGKKHTDETKKKISETKKGIPNVKLSVKIICTTTGEIFNSQKDAAKKMNLRQPSISRVCTKVRKRYKGFTFMFYDEYLKNK